MPALHAIVRFALSGALAFITAIAAVPAHANDEWLQEFRDPSDGRIDMSRWLLSRRGALPVPLIITEPAVGYGAGLGLVFFHRKEPGAAGGEPAGETSAGTSAGSGQRALAPPSVSGIL